jgi:hypothetical protein
MAAARHDYTVNRLRQLRYQLSARWDDWNRGRFLSRTERRLTVSLWLLAIVGVAFVYVHRVWLVDQPPLFHHAAQWGDVTHEIAIGYLGAFAFYILNIRLLQRRDRRNIYRHLAPLVSRVVGEATNLIQHLNDAAAVEVGRTNTWPNVENTCASVNLNQLTDALIREPSGAMRQATVIENMEYDMGRAQEVNRELLKYPSYLSTEMVSLLVDIDEQGYFKAFERYKAMGHFQTATDLSLIAREIFDYLQLADHVDDYRNEFLPLTFRRRPELIAASVRGSSATPLGRVMNRGAPVTKPLQRWHWIRSRRLWLIVLLAVLVLISVAMYKTR